MNPGALPVTCPVFGLIINMAVSLRIEMLTRMTPETLGMGFSGDVTIDVAHSVYRRSKDIHWDPGE